MPQNILPIQDLDKIGLIADAPPVSLPANAFSDVLNVRFKDGAVRKMEGQVNIFRGLFEDDDIVKYVAWWPSPNLAQLNTGYYLVIVEQEVFDVDLNTDVIKDVAYFVKPGDTRLVEPKGTFESSETWQHTFFQGGFALIINNGIDVPRYVLDPEGNEAVVDIPMFANLPGWDSYEINERILDGVFEEGNSRVFNLGQAVDFDINRVIVEVFDSESVPTPVVFTPADSQEPPVMLDVYAGQDGTNEGLTFKLYTDTTTATTVVVFGDGLVTGNLARINIRSRNPVEVRTGVIRSFGDFLVAGNLTERDQTDPEIIVRSLPGVVRSSDVAAPGAIPNNWNPFATGVSTADEFVVTQDGIVQDLVELQSNLYIYSNNSISVMRLTGNPTVPLTVVPVTTSYGCLTTEGVLEYDGKHVVVGSQDIYLFGGHPGSIQSIADARVRNLFYSRLNPLQERSVFMLRYQQQDEIWICYASSDAIGAARDEALIWNYRNNTWTKRSLPSVYSGNIGPVPGGGLPLAQINLDGNASDNAEILPGSPETQEIAVNNALVIPRTGEGFTQHTDITVETEAFDTGDGPSLFEVVLRDGFMSGDERPLNISFTGVRPVGDIGDPNVFSFEVPLTPGLNIVAGATASNAETIAAIKNILINNDPFDENFEYHDVATSVGLNRFIIRGKNPEVAATSLMIGSKRFFTVNDLEPAPDNGLLGTMNGADSTSTRNLYVSTVFIPPENVDLYHFFDIPSLPAGTPLNIFRVNPNADYVSSLGADTDMYESIGGQDDMYLAGRGGLVRRPLRERLNLLTANSPSQRWYKTRTSVDSTELEITEAFIPITSGLYDFYVEIPLDAGVVENLNFTTRRRPLPTDGTEGLFDNDNTERRGTPTAGAPVLTFNTYYQLFDPEITRKNNADVEGAYGDDNIYVTEPVQTLVAIAGNYMSDASARQQIAEHIRDIFENEVIGLWQTRDADHTDNIAGLESRGIGAYRLELSAIGGRTVFGDTTIAVEDFTIDNTVREGRWNWTNSDTFDVDAGFRPAHYPRYRFDNQGSQGINTFTSVRAEFNLDPLGESSLSSSDVAALIETNLSALPGWDDVLTNDANTLRLITARIDGNIDPGFTDNIFAGSDTPANRPAVDWTFNRISTGNVSVHADPNTDVVAIESIGVVPGLEGDYETRNTPSYLFLQIRNSEALQSTNGYANQELFIVEAPAGLEAEPLSTEWILRIRRANPRLVVRNEGNAGQFSIQPSNYGDLANFVLVPVLNNSGDATNPVTMVTTDNIDACKELLRASIYYDGTGDRIQLHPASAIPYIDLPHRFAQNGYTMFQQGIIPENGTELVNASLIDDNTGIQGVSLVFDAIRPWPAEEVNFNFEVPIFAARQDVLSRSADNIQTSRPINKIIGADIGWTTPAFSTVDIDDTFPTPSTRVINGNDAPLNYESFIERKTLPLSPEFDTELLSSMALWADGSTVERFNEEPNYNRLELRSAGSNNPGANIDLTAPGPTSQDLRKNVYLVSEDYKLDVRTNGRFFNLRVTDNIIDQSTIESEEDINKESFTVDTKVFRQDSEWRLSGIQLDIGKAGTR